MRLHLPPKQYKVFREEIRKAQRMPQITPAYLAELARRRDQYLLTLAR